MNTPAIAVLDLKPKPSPRALLDQSRDYAALVDELAAEAAAGNPEAQYVTYRALHFCDAFNKAYLSGSNGRQRTIDELLAHRANQISGRPLDSLTASYDRCKSLLEDGNRADALRGADAWLDAAVDARYPAAMSDKAAELRRAELLNSTTDSTTPQFSVVTQRAFGMALDAAASGDPRSIFLMSDWVSGENRTQEEYGALTGAWKIYACQSGYDCGTTSDFMFSVCNSDPACVPGQTYIDYYQRLLGNQYTDAVQLANQIGSAISTRDPNALKPFL